MSASKPSCIHRRRYIWIRRIRRNCGGVQELSRSLAARISCRRLMSWSKTRARRENKSGNAAAVHRIFALSYPHQRGEIGRLMFKNVLAILVFSASAFALAAATPETEPQIKENPQITAVLSEISAKNIEATIR